MKPRERLPYRAIENAVLPPLPNDLQVIVWPLIVLEEWELDRPLPRQAVPQPLGKSLIPDVLNWTWHEYGMRVGFWRLKEIFDEASVPACVPINAQVIEHYPEIAKACFQSGWPFLGHGTRQVPLHYDDNPMDTIQGSFDAIKAFTGSDPKGWLGPGLAQTFDTPDQLSDAGFQYMADWVLDDVPVWVEANPSKLAALPYNLEVNDIPLINVARNEADYFTRRALATHEELLREAKAHDRPKFMSIALHPYLSGTPERAAEIRKLLQALKSKPGTAFWTGDQVFDWFTENSK